MTERRQLDLQFFNVTDQVLLKPHDCYVLATAIEHLGRRTIKGFVDYPRIDAEQLIEIGSRLRRNAARHHTTYEITDVGRAALAGREGA